MKVISLMNVLTPDNETNVMLCDGTSCDSDPGCDCFDSGGCQGSND